MVEVGVYYFWFIGKELFKGGELGIEGLIEERFYLLVI